MFYLNEHNVHFVSNIFSHYGVDRICCYLVIEFADFPVLEVMVLLDVDDKCSDIEDNTAI